MIDFKNVSYSYTNGAMSVKNLSFHISKGEFVAIAGENGAGKSTTSKLINGLLKPSEGTVTTAGMDTKSTRVSTLAKHIGFLFQNPDRQLCCASVSEEIQFSLNLITDMTQEQKEKRTEELLSLFSLDGKSEPFSLSRGERQKVAMASVLAAQPEILILDEPTTGLDYKECSVIMDFVKRLNEEKNITVVMVCHDMEVVLDYADRVIAMAGGKIIDDDSTKVLFRKKQVLAAASLLQPQIIELSESLGGEFSDCTKAEEIIRTIKELKERGMRL